MYHVRRGGALPRTVTGKAQKCRLADAETSEKYRLPGDQQPQAVADPLGVIGHAAHPVD